MSERADNWPPLWGLGQRDWRLATGDWRRLLSYKSHSINHIQGINYIFIFCCAFLLNVNRRQTGKRRERERRKSLQIKALETLMKSKPLEAPLYFSSLPKLTAKCTTTIREQQQQVGSTLSFNSRKSKKLMSAINILSGIVCEVVNF